MSGPKNCRLKSEAAHLFSTGEIRYTVYGILKHDIGSGSDIVNCPIRGVFSTAARHQPHR